MNDLAARFRAVFFYNQQNNDNAIKGDNYD